MAEFKVDVTNCDKEPIRIPGRIQAHGFLIGVNSNTLRISSISENAGSFIGDKDAVYLGKHIDDIEIGMKIFAQRPGLKFSQILLLGAANGFESINPFYIAFNKRSYNLIINNSADIHLLEFEPCNKAEDFDVQKTIGLAISEILAEAGLQAMLNTAVRQIRKIIQYDRVMIYRFAEDGHGEVVAEEKNSELDPYLGLHYPASDIPQQARELYKINLTRIIADVNAPCPVILSGTQTNSPLDLTHAVLRAVSPIHIQYLKNMGVSSSFSISLLSHGELWGLIACHNYTPKFIDYKAREASKLIGQILSPALEYRLGEEDSENFALFNQSINTIIKYTEKETDLAIALTANNVTINDICATTGAALIFDNAITNLGSTPAEEQIKELATWILTNTNEGIFYTDRLPSLFSPAKKYSAIASGVFACNISKELGEIILFFKPEKKQTISWAGNPEKSVTAATDGSLQLSPRASFASWLQTIEETSEKWTRSEITALLNFREEIVYQISRKANEIRNLNERLKLAYDELDTFSFTVSHDLRTPLTAIKGYTEMLLVGNQSLDENAKVLLNRINTSADRMAVLIKDILHYSSFARNEINLTLIDMRQLIENIRSGTESLLHVDLEFTIGPTPNLYCDPVMMEQVFSNLLGNAFKYSSKKDRPVVKIAGDVLDDETIYTVSDNGIGIDSRHHNQVFDMFKRMSNVKDFDGTGVGLAIVKRIVERHQGRIWFESELGKGTVF